MDRILVIGATGNIGRHVVSQLVAAGASVRAMTRNPETAQFPPQVEVVRGDLTVPDTLDRSLQDLESLFLLWQASPAAVAPAFERITKRVPRIVALTSPHKTPHPFFQQPNRLREMHAEIDRLVESSGCEWTILRPGMLAFNCLSWWAPQIRAGAEVVRWPYPNCPTSPVHEGDIAAVAVRALREDGHNGAEYVLTGPESLTQAEQLAAISGVIGRPLRLEEMSPDDAQRELAGLIPVTMLLNAWAAGMGRPAHVTSTIAEVTGRPARTFSQWVSDNVAQFRN